MQPRPMLNHSKRRQNIKPFNVEQTCTDPQVPLGKWHEFPMACCQQGQIGEAFRIAMSALMKFATRQAL